MPGSEFFERMQPEFEQQAGTAREIVERQADVERLIATGEYECVQLRRELSGLLDFGGPPQPVEAKPDADSPRVPLAPAKAA